MGQAAFTVVGQVVGAYFGGPVGAAIGGAIGSYVGGRLFPQQLPTQEGPRLDDMRVQSSTYGKAVAIPFGTVRMAGNIIWATDLRETRTVEEIGGKGGGPEGEAISYSYDVDCAIALGAGPCFGIRRMWINGIPVFDARAPTDPMVIDTYGGDTNTILRALKENSGGADALTFYPGNESQLPDPTIEASLGAGNVPAYRGICYVVFTKFQLARWGNRIPQFEFELVTAGTSTAGERLARTQDTTQGYRNEASFLQSLPVPIVTDLSESIRVTAANNLIADNIIRVYGYDAVRQRTDVVTDWERGFPPMPIVGAGEVVNLWKMADGALLKLTLPNAPAVLKLEAIGGALNELGDYSAVDMLYHIPTITVGGVAPCSDGRHVLVVGVDGGGVADSWHLLRYAGDAVEVVDSGTMGTLGSSSTTYQLGVGPIMQMVGYIGAMMLDTDLRHVWRVIGSGIEVWRIDPVTGVLAVTPLTFGGGASDLGSTTPKSMYCAGGLCAVVGGANDSTSSWVYLFNRNPAIARTPVTVGQIVSALCLRVGLTAGEIDVTELTRECYGFIVGDTMTARAAIEALMRAYNFDAAESGGKIIFRMRTATPAVTLTAEQLGAGSGDGAALVESARTQQTELPAEVNVLYWSANADYQQGAQAARRQNSGSLEKAEFPLPVVMTDTEAAQAADMLLYQAWVGRNQRRFSTTHAYAHVEPTDVVQLALDDVTAVTRLTAKKQTGGRIEWEAADVDAAAFTSTAVAAGLPSRRGMAVLAPTHLEVLDIPALRATDDNAGVYLSGYASAAGAWPGAAILRSVNRDGPYLRAASLYTRATTGAAETVLAPYTGGNTFDEINTVTVRMLYGAPTSATEAAVLDGANVAVLGSEIIQWKTATSLGGDLYRLSGLLRGRRATEQHMATHALGERFVAMTAATLARLELDNGVIGTPIVYRPVTFSAVPNAVFDVWHRHIGASKLPALVTGVTAVRNGANDVIFQWIRRDRLAWEWVDQIDLPLNEARERYTLEILSGAAGAPVRTVNDLSSPTYSYPRALEAVDFPASLTPLATHYVRIYQMSDAVGRGFAQTITLTGLA